MSNPIIERPDGLEPVYTHPNSEREYFVVRSQRPHRRVSYRLVACEHISDWQDVEKGIPEGYWIDLPRRGKPMLKRMRGL